MINVKVSEILETIDCKEYVGDKDAIISKLTILDGENQEPTLLFWCSDSNIHRLSLHLKGTIICSRKIFDQPHSKFCNFMVVENPRLTFTNVINKFFHYPEISGISNTAIIDRSVVLGSGACIGDNVTIEGDCIIGQDVSIGHNTVLKSNTVIGDNVVIGSCCTIGGCGFGYETGADGQKLRINHIGGVRLSNRVEIGNNVCIDRGVIGDTTLREGVLVDNLAHISHNVVIGKDSMIFALTVTCGSTTIGERTNIAPGASLINKISVGDDVQIGMGAVVTKDVISKSVAVGNPAKIIR